ncbi:MAG: DUF805 domain-containing protein [Thiohalocapsa sp.]|jgi:uncharacterized membrane protein YhaH (DUF805 family)|uniref:DUF805 domain-containing protein n=1 Tax=Thiohalocapsa sp. TaxID=2497641 RepID=UPI0025E4A7CF|nr:DUF805 domain-containing protein [Thiohalocapsa sp.]
MFKALWGDIQTGRLKRLPFLGWYLVILALAMVLSFALGAVIGAAERMAGGEPIETQVALGESLGPVGLIAVAAVFALLLLGQMNIMAKRLRDMGLPMAWLLVLGWLLLAGLVSSAGGAVLSGLLSVIVLLGLLSVPTGALRGRGAGPGQP